MDTQDGIWQGELTPYIQVKELFDTIMDEAGFTYDSTFFDTTGGGNFSAMYLPAYNGNQTLSGVDFLDNTVRRRYHGQHHGSTRTRSARCSSTIPSREDNDPEDNFANAVGGGVPGHRYTAPYTGYYSVKVTHGLRPKRQGRAPSHIKIYLYKNGSLLETLVDDQLYSTKSIFLDHVFDGSGIGTGLSGPAILLAGGDYRGMVRDLGCGGTGIWALAPATGTGSIGNMWTTSFEVFATSQALFSAAST